jgi:hypothetical protein
MPLEKLQMTQLDKSGNKIPAKKFNVLFNPTTYTITSSVSWKPMSSRELNTPMLTYGGGGGRTLTLDLFYDVTEPVNNRRIGDVRQETNKVVNLSRKDRDLARPPAVSIEWGSAPLTGSDFPFIGVLSSVSQTFTMFRPDGTPVRARLNVTFTEFADPEIDQRKLDPEFTIRLVKRGDTVSSIAADQYGDARLWRVIATANRIWDPLKVDAGVSLRIPKII